MDINATLANAATLEKELEWFKAVLDQQLAAHAGGSAVDIGRIANDNPPPSLQAGQSLYAGIITHYNASFSERFILMLALAPHIKPHLLDVFYTINQGSQRGFTEFGGIKGQNHGGFLPTGETAAFLLAGDNLANRFQLLEIFGEDHFFRKFNIIRLVPPGADEPLLSGMITLSTEYLNYFTRASYQPDYSMNFPAKRITTDQNWEDLVIDGATRADIEEINCWIRHGETLMNSWGMNKKLKPGFRALFYGPPGTGKTLTATLLGKQNNMDVYRIDLSMVVSKYIGETEKNLAVIFDQAENKNWILFFDEADALFGKRTQTSSSNDRYANQEVSYLLQRVEDFSGVTILASNLRANIDEAFSRRIQSMVYFSMPAFDQRLILWKKSFPENTTLEENVNLKKIAADYEMAGGAIINVTRYASLMALNRGDTIIMNADIMTGIRKELAKDGKTM
jgi:hypothetical protein